MFSRFCVSRQTLVSCWRFNQPEARNLGRNKHVRVAVQEGHEKSGSASLLHMECWKCGMSAAATSELMLCKRGKYERHLDMKQSQTRVFQRMEPAPHQDER